MATNLTTENIKTIAQLDALSSSDIAGDDLILVQDVSASSYKKATLLSAVDNIASPVRTTAQTLTDDQKSQARSNIGLGNVDNTSDANKTVKSAKNASYFAICSTAAATKAKTVVISGFSLVAGARITVKFTNGNTYGTATGTASNIIAAGSCPTLNVQSTGAKKIYVGGEPAGEGFINSGDVHDFVYDGTNWCDVTADVIYKGGNDTDGYYEKKRNGKITQRFYKAKGSAAFDVTFPIVFTNTNYVTFGTCIQSSDSFSIGIRVVSKTVSKVRLYRWFEAGSTASGSTDSASDFMISGT